MSLFSVPSLVLIRPGAQESIQKKKKKERNCNAALAEVSAPVCASVVSLVLCLVCVLFVFGVGGVSHL